MELHEIEKIRKVYKDLKKLWEKEPFASFTPYAIQDLSDIIADAIQDRQNAAEEAAKVKEQKKNEQIEDISDWTDERLRRKAEQAWEMSGLARQDGDMKDSQRHTDFARHCENELANRH